MGKSAPRAPTPPDPRVTIPLQQQAQQQAARESGTLAAVDVFSPFGNVEFQRRTSGPFAGTAESQTITLPPEVQAAIEAQNRLRSGLAGRAEGILEGVPEGGFQIPTGLPGAPSQLGELPQAQALSFAGLPDVSRGVQVAGPSGPAPLSLQGLPGVGTDFGAQREAQTQASFSRASSLFEPQFEQQSSQLEQQIANRGIPFAGEEATRLRENLQRSQGEQRERAAFTAVGVGAQEEGRLFGQQIQARGQGFGERVGQFQTGLSAREQAAQEAQASFQSILAGRGALGQEQQQLFQAGQAGRQQNIREQLTNAQLAQTARQTGISESLLQREQSLNEISAILAGSPSIQQPNLPPIPQIGVGSADVLGAFGQQQQGQQFATNLQAQQNASQLAGLTSILTAGAKVASSKDWKDRKAEIDHGDTLDKVKGLRVEAWHYRPEIMPDDQEPHIGPYAEEFNEAFKGETGKTIDTVDAFGVALSAIKGLAAQVDQIKAQIEQKEAA